MSKTIKLSDVWWQSLLSCSQGGLCTAIDACGRYQVKVCSFRMLSARILRGVDLCMFDLKEVCVQQLTLCHYQVNTFDLRVCFPPKYMNERGTLRLTRTVKVVARHRTRLIKIRRCLNRFS